jgi:hypothetical protein
VKLLAAIGPDERTLVFVVVNNTKRSIDLKIKLPREFKFNESVSFETSERHDLGISPSQPPTDQYTFSPQSVTTVQLTINNL